MPQESNKINCPNCGFEIDVNEILYHQLEDQIRKDFAQRSEEKDREVRLKTEELNRQKQQMEKDREALEEKIAEKVNSGMKQEKEKLEQKLRQKLTEENEEQMKEMKEELEQKSAQLKELARTRAEIERLKRDQELMADKISLEKEKEYTEKLREERAKVAKQAEEGAAMKMREKEKLIEDLKTQLDEAKRKMDQGSMQLQGEVQELAIEEWLKESFPLDTIGEIKKGARGADCIQTVNTRTSSNCGIIYYESKRTKDFQPAWIEKFKADMRSKGAEFGVLVTDSLPKGMDRFGNREGIWICTFSEFKALCFLIREMVIRLHGAAAAQENKGDKMSMMYDFLTGSEFRRQMEAIVEGFVQMNQDLDSERRAMESIWKKREKQISKVLLNTNHMYSSIKGIAGNAIGSIKVLELGTGEQNEE